MKMMKKIKKIKKIVFVDLKNFLIKKNLYIYKYK